MLETLFTLKSLCFFMFHLINDPELRNDSILTPSSGRSLRLRGSELSGYSLEKTVEGTRLSLPFETRLLKKGVKMLSKYIHTYLDSISMYTCVYSFHIHSSRERTGLLC